ncbi:hypothetical protein LUW77_00125 [Streptomyces radiopugnans]|nr:hypothetical protein LUW77_00125 [Streptomyces radiopugnans]
MRLLQDVADHRRSDHACLSSTRRSSPPPHRGNATARQAPPDAVSEFTPLLRDVEEQGLLARRPGWYARTRGSPSPW